MSVGGPVAQSNLEEVSPYTLFGGAGNFLDGAPLLAGSYEIIAYPVDKEDNALRMDIELAVATI